MGSGLAAAVIILILLTVFAVFVLQITARAAGSRIKKRVVDEIQVYDSLIQQKESELQVIQNKIESRQESFSHKDSENESGSSSPGTAYMMPPADYANQAIFDDYAKIRKHFSVSQPLLKDSVHKIQQQFSQKTAEVYQMLAEKLSFDNVYKISELRSEEQKDVLESILSDEEKGILSDYCTTTGEFDCIGFYNWLHIRLQTLDREVRVLTAWGDSPDGISGLNSKYSEWKVLCHQDEQLAEGFQIRAGNKFCDCGIRQSELIS